MQTDAARLTILMPVKHYHPVFLQKALDCVQNQTKPSWHLHVIVEPRDLAHFADLLEKPLQDSRIQLICNEGRGLSGAFNTGMRHAQSDFAAILLADDLWDPQTVEVLDRNIRSRPNVDFFHSSRRYIDEEDRPISSIYQSKEQFRVEDFFNSPPVKHLLCWRIARAMEFGGMDESLNSYGPDDYDFPWCMAEHGAVFQAIPECLYLYRDHRETYRLTTHEPLDAQKWQIHAILTKHGASADFIQTRLSQAESSYLRQSLFKSSFDRWIKRLFGWKPREIYRESYR